MSNRASTSRAYVAGWTERRWERARLPRLRDLLRALLAHADLPHDPDPDQHARDRLDRVDEVRVVTRRDAAADDEAEHHGADHRADERAHDARPEAVRQEDREVPDGQADHHPHEHGHQWF